MTSSVNGNSANAIIERKCRPIYDLLDDGAYSSALQQLQKIQKKHPDSELLLSLRLFALARLGKREEAIDCYNHLMQNPQKPIPQDEGVIQAAVLALKTLGMTSDMAHLYEKLVESQPTNLEWKKELFLTNVRLSDFRGQQRIAAQLYQSQKSPSAKQSNRYLFWNISSFVLCSIYEYDASKKKMSLTLADRMLSRCVEEKRFETVEELKFYLSVLEMQEKYQEALEFLEGEWGQKMKMEMERDKLKLSLMAKLHLWDRLCTEGLEIWRKYPDDFECFEYALDAAEKHTDSSTRMMEVQATAKDLCDMELTTESKYQRRGPFIALMEHATVIKSCEKLVNAIEQYFKIFSSKLCSFSDMSKYIYFIAANFENGDVVPNLIKRLEKYNKPIDASLSAAENRKLIIAEICLEKVRRILVPIAVTEYLNESKRLYQRYLDTLVYGADLDKMELQPSDDFLLMAAHSIVQHHMNDETKDLKHIIEACIMLEQGSEKSKANFQFKLLLIQLYRYIANVDGMKRMLVSLDIKNILNDTVGYRVVNHLNALGNDVSETVTMLFKSYGIYLSNRRETPEMTIQAYEYETYSRIAEFVAFGKKLESSLQRATACHLLNQAIHWQDLRNDKSKYSGSITHDLVENVTEWRTDILKGLQDTRDYSLMQFYEPQCRIRELERFLSCKQEFVGSLEFIKLHGMMEALVTADTMEAIKTLATSLKEGLGASDFVKRVSHLICSESYSSFCEPNHGENFTTLLPAMSNSLDELLFANRLLLSLKKLKQQDFVADLKEMFNEELARIVLLSQHLGDTINENVAKLDDLEPLVLQGQGDFMNHIKTICQSWHASLMNLNIKINLLK